MEDRTRQSNHPKQRLVNRLDAATRDLNAVLLVLAIGLAVLDLTCFLAVEIRSALPPTRTGSAALAEPRPATPLGNAAAPAAKAGAAATGW